MRMAIGAACSLVIAAVLPLVGTGPMAHATPQSSLEGAVIVLDPGHQLGNSNPKFAKQMAQKKFNGSIVKECNTTGTATNAGLPEATFTWKVANQLKDMLEARGATVVLTRQDNSYESWGPCTWDRAHAGAAAQADLMVSIHADGAPSGGHGFHVIAPTRIEGFTDDVVKDDRVLARNMIDAMSSAGATPSTYIDGALLVSSIMTTLNLSDVPSVIVELGNMRNAKEAKLMSSGAGQRQYADWLLAGITKYLERESS